MPIELSALVDQHAQTPKFRQLAANLREAIDDGRLEPGEELPSEAELRTATGISRDTVRKAIGLLAGEGLVIVRHGAPTRVSPAPPQRPLDASRYLNALRILKAGGPIPNTSAFIEDHGIAWNEYGCDMQAAKEAATAEDARRLEIPVGTPLLRRHFLKSGNGIPLQIQRSAMLWDLAGGTPVADPGMQPWPLGTIAELWSLGLEVTTVDEDVRSRQPRDEERRALAMQTPGPVFDIVRVMRVGERPVEASRVIIPADRNVLHYRVHLDLTQD